MFERYTESARRAIFFARYEASQFGSPTIETEHVLLGLLQEDKDLAARLFGSNSRDRGRSSDVKLPAEVVDARQRIQSILHGMENAIAIATEVRKRIESLRQPHQKIAASVDLPLSHPSKRVLAYGAEEAKRLNHNHIGPEHLLLGLLREEASMAAQILRERGLSAAGVRAEMAPPSSGLEQGRNYV